jgi:hypothetical protein
MPGNDDSRRRRETGLHNRDYLEQYLGAKWAARKQLAGEVVQNVDALNASPQSAPSSCRAPSATRIRWSASAQNSPCADRQLAHVANT